MEQLAAIADDLSQTAGNALMQFRGCMMTGYLKPSCISTCTVSNSHRGSQQRSRLAIDGTLSADVLGCGWVAAGIGSDTGACGSRASRHRQQS